MSNNKEGFPKPHNLSINDFKFISNDSIGYLKNRSGGVVYSFNGNDFNRLDKSFEFKTQNFSYSFLHDNKLMDFGGYGLFTFKNIITFFDIDKRETDLYPQKSSYENSPSSRHKMIGQYIDGELFIGPGYGVNFNQEDPLKNYGLKFDYWKFSFETSTWKKLGDGNIDISFPKYSTIDNYNQNVLLIDNHHVYEVDIKNNIIITYSDAKINFFESINKSNDEYKIIYNKSKDGFYIILDKIDYPSEVIFISRDDFLGSRKEFSSLYIEENDFPYHFLGGLLIVGLIVFYVKSKKTTSKKIESNFKIIRNEIKLDDFRIIKRLVDASPNYINYSELFDVFPDHYGYESLQKKTRHSLLNIEEYLVHKMKLKSPIFEYRRNIEDKREKQIRIKN
ncbi:MAG: hypothetical protein HWE24_17620 [Oceanospirillaceae bacterium]|nr:hypothetical protein [Oceanospirillaceae bacterium]